ncbi:MAG: leucyl/phenylalanyl-tRNA--protein transferase [Verrucomicrobia bacterium]|nr:leucyl/phenylalanyl-tRNA--protein transferase [Verrucomicrobiota bacterium]
MQFRARLPIALPGDGTLGFNPRVATADSIPALLDRGLWFPDPREARETHGLGGMVAIGGDLQPERLLLAYRSGIFPWTVDPVTWWSPDPRAVFELDRMHVPRSLARVMRRGAFEVTENRAFRGVMEGCARARRSGNWISRDFIEAYTRLHELGHAHSVECWQDGKLAGGIYGVAVGGLFAGESMFHRVSDASKVALVSLAARLRERGFTLFDIQMMTDTTARFGAVEISRDAYLDRLAAAVRVPCEFATGGSPRAGTA